MRLRQGEWKGQPMRWCALMGSKFSNVLQDMRGKTLCLPPRSNLCARRFSQSPRRYRRAIIFDPHIVCGGSNIDVEGHAVAVQNPVIASTLRSRRFMQSIHSIY